MAQTWPAATPVAFEVCPCLGWPSPGPSPLNVKASRTAWASPGGESWKRERERDDKKKEKTKKARKNERRKKERKMQEERTKERKGERQGGWSTVDARITAPP